MAPLQWLMFSRYAITVLSEFVCRRQSFTFSSGRIVSLINDYGGLCLM
jgi:hypothetical protein